MIVNVGGRTDIVNYYSEWLMKRIEEGFAYSRNPLFPKRISKIPLKPEEVDCLLFCSKNYTPILKYMNQINEKYHIVCYYTITAYDKDVEPNVPSIQTSIQTLIQLSQMIGKQKVLWRYDPILLTKKYTVEKHLQTFEFMAKKISPYVQRCIFSFVDMYKKLYSNMPEIIPFTEKDKIKILKGIGEIAQKNNLLIQTCGTDENYEKYGIHQSGCSTAEILEQANQIKYKDVKARFVRKGCNCIPSRDIGAYDSCPNGCKYCYANKNPDVAKENIKLHDLNSPLLIGNIKETDKITDAEQMNLIIEETGEQISFI